jgi:hypothetical protein
MYLLGPDVELLTERLDSDEEIAWLVTNGPGRWVARPEHPALDGDRYGLWHVPSGPLPLLTDWGDDASDGLIENPWSGWQEKLEGADSDIPYFGAGHPGVYWLNLRTSGGSASRGVEIGLSSFEWIGNHYRAIGSPAKQTTQRHWRRLRYWVAKRARLIPRIGRLNGPESEIYAFPAALSAIKAGAKRAANPG